MEIQKSTVLDIARATLELASLVGARIVESVADDSRAKLYIRLTDPDSIIKFVVAPRFAYIGQASDIPPMYDKVFPLIAGFAVRRCEQVNYDRILKIQLEKRDRLGRSRKLYLILEVIPNKGNAILTDENGTIKAALKKKEGTSYSPPVPLKKPSILNFKDEQLAAIIESRGDPGKEIYGLNRRDLVNLGLTLKGKPAAASLREYSKMASRPGPAWKIIYDNQITGYSIVEPVLNDGETAEKSDSALLLYESYYGDIIEDDKAEGGAKPLLKILNKELEKAKKKISAIEAELVESEKAQILRTYGEMILTNIAKINRGISSIKLRNIETSDPEYFDIELDPAISPSANANNYFKKFKKAAASQNTLRKRLDETRERLGHLEGLKASYVEDPESLRSGLQKLKLIPPTGRRISAKFQLKRQPYKRFISSCGWEILVGRSNADNDELTFYIASKEDYWFHAWQAAGSHTVLRLPNKNSVPDRKTLLEAASLAAYFSKARGSLKVPVIYTQAKYVRKPRKFPPGKVLVEREKQLMVRPADPKEFGVEEHQ